MPSPSVEVKQYTEEIVKRYGTAEQIMALFNPDLQSRYVSEERRCLTGNAPSIARMAKAYGENIAISWLSIQIYDLVKFCSFEDKIDINQVNDVAVILFTDAPFLKLTEWMMFFYRFKRGEYGEFFGRFDGVKVGVALKEFKSWRRSELDRYSNEERREREKAEEKAHSERVAEFKRNLGRPIRISELRQYFMTEDLK